MNPLISGSYREIQIVNGKLVKNVELEEKVSPEKDVIKGYIDGKPVFMTRNLRRSNKGRRSNKVRSNKGRSNKRRPKRKTAKK